MEHISLEIYDLKGTDSQYASLPEDASITVNETSELFASGDVWSHSFSLNVRANSHIFSTAGDMNGTRLHDQINKRHARLWVDGIPIYYGYILLNDEAEVDANGNVDISFESGQKTFEEMIEGAKANQVPMMNDVRFGVALWRERWACVNVKLKAAAVFTDGSKTDSEVVTHTVHNVEIGDEDTELTPFSADSEKEENSVQRYPRMVFPKGKFNNLKTGVKDEIVDFLNTDNPYDESHPYCNVALCYQKSGYLKKNQDGSFFEDYGSEPETQRGYEVMPANRVNSAPNFFVIYWIKSLMKHLGIHINENQMMDVEDLRRLFFVNTNCAYKEPKCLRNPSYDQLLGKYQFGSGGDLVPEYFGEKNGNRFNGPSKISKLENCQFTSFGITVGKLTHDGTNLFPEEIQAMIENLQIERIDIKPTEVSGMSESVRAYYDGYGSNKSLARNRFLHDAVATSDCFPNVDISDVIKAIETGFGVRFLFSENYKHVRIILLRNIFHDDEVQNITCEIISERKVENCIRGFRMTYGDSSDTTFYYKGFADKLTDKKELWIDNSDLHDYSNWDLNADYGKLINKISAFDKTCYVDPKTGNAFGIKVDKDAKRYEDLHPSLFEYAGYMDAEDGDCTGEEETIETVQVGFAPAIMNDVNFEQERNGSDEQRYALFVDASMRPRRPSDLFNSSSINSYNDADAMYDVVNLYSRHGPNSKHKMTSDDGIVKPGEFAISSDMFVRKSGLNVILKELSYRKLPNTFVHYKMNLPISFSIEGHVNEGFRLYLQDNFEPNDDGVSPIEAKDWGLTLGIMRGSGSDAYVRYEADPDDGEGNDTWEIMAGSNVTAHPDTCDNYGREWDYNGTTDGRFSLKLRAEKINPYFDPKKPESAANRRYLEISNPNLRGRGLMDQFYKEYSFWVRNARIAILTVRMEMAQLRTLDKAKKVTVGDITGFIRKIQYSVSNKTGVGNVTMEIMYI